MKWVTKKPKFNKECLLIVATWIAGYWEYDIFTVEKVDGYNEEDEPCYYWGLICKEGDEWGDINDLVADKYLVLPLLKKQKHVA